MTAMFLSQPWHFAEAKDMYVIKVPEECRTIKQAYEASLPGDTILLSAGEFTVESGVIFRGNTKLVGQGADRTIIKVSAPGLMIDSRGQEPALNNIVIKDLTIVLEGGPVRVNWVNGFLLDSCIITSKDNSTGLWISSTVNAEIRNCTIANNGYGIFLWYEPIGLTVRNTILYNNKVGLVVGNPPVVADTRLWPEGEAEKVANRPRTDIKIDLKYNVFWNLKDIVNYPRSELDKFADPKLKNPSKDDFHLSGNSPCIDAGDPDKKYNDPDGSRSDIGAFPSGGKKRN